MDLFFPPVYVMPQTLSLAQFYRDRLPEQPPHLAQDLAHFNVFRSEEYVGPQARPLPYSRKDFYKISLVLGCNRYHYADKVLSSDGPALLFVSPQVPYQWEKLEGPQGGMFCVFRAGFLPPPQPGGRVGFPVFEPGGQPLYHLTPAQQLAAQAIFDKMLREIDSDYPYKYDLLRAYVLELIHGAQKLVPVPARADYPNAAARITALFTELLARQFPIESPQQRLRLRSAQDFANQLAVHVNHLNRALKAVTGKTTTQLLAARLVQEASALLRHTDWPVAQVGYCLGFEEPSHFTQFFRQHTGQTPSVQRMV